MTNTDQILDFETPHKIYNDKAIWIGTFIGGPLAAGYLIAENFKVFKDFESATRTWVFTVLATILIFGIIFIIPEDINVPNQVIPIFYTTIAYFLAKRYQGEEIESHLNLGGKIFGWGRILTVSLIGLIITSIALFGVAFLMSNTESLSESTKTYGILNHEITFDSTNVTEKEIDKMADGFTNAGFFDNVVTKYVYVIKKENSYEIYISVTQKAVKNEEIIKAYIDLKKNMQVLFPTDKIILKLTGDSIDDVLKTLE